MDVEGIGGYQQPRCPQCDSLDVSFEGLNRPLSYASLFLNIPIPLHEKGWRCENCRYRWETEADPQEQ